MSDAPDWEGFGRAIMAFGWPAYGDIEATQVFDLALEYRLIKPIPGGYDPDEHVDDEAVSPEPGDPWYEYNFQPIARWKEAGGENE